MCRGGIGENAIVKISFSIGKESGHGMFISVVDSTMPSMSPQLSQHHVDHVVQNAAMLEVAQLDFGVEAQDDLETATVAELKRKRPQEFVNTSFQQHDTAINFEPLNIKNRQLAIFHKAVNGHLALHIENRQPVLHHTRHPNSKAFNIIHASNDRFTNIHYFPGH